MAQHKPAAKAKPAAKGKYVVKPKSITQSDQIGGPMPAPTPPLSSGGARRQLRGW